MKKNLNKLVTIHLIHEILYVNDTRCDFWIFFFFKVFNLIKIRTNNVRSLNVNPTSVFNIIKWEEERALKLNAVDY